MTDEQLAEVEARLKAATPGPWEVDNGGNRTTHAIVYGNHLLGRFPVCELNKRDRSTTSHKPQREGPMQEANADFIARAPTDIATLLAEVKRRDKMIAEATYALRKVIGNPSHPYGAEPVDWENFTVWAENWLFTHNLVEPWEAE